MSKRIEIVKELRALESFFTTRPVRTADEQNRFLADYLADVQDFPLDAIRSACAAWRKSGATRFPTSGQLIPMIRSYVRDEKPRINEPWRPLSDEEYGDLTLRDKVRHHRIMAHEARCKAGPMFRNTTHLTKGRPSGVHLTAEEMTEKWRHWTAEAERHEEEAWRLNQVLIRAARP